jgi:hypothetical protein
MADTKAPAAKAAKTSKTAPVRPKAKPATANVAETVTSAAPVEKTFKQTTAAEAIAAPMLKAVESLMPKPVEAVQPALKAIDLAVQAVAAAPKSIPVLPADAMVAPVSSLVNVGAEQARQAYARAQATSQNLRQAVTETATATSQGVLEVNGKVLDAMRAQSDAAFDLWRSTLTAGSVSEAIRAQTSGARQVYETTATQWKDVAEATNRWFTAAMKPMQQVWTAQGR